MGFSELDLQNMQARLTRNRSDATEPVAKDAVPDGQESKLHDEIAVWCNLQFPRWKILYARRDKKSTLPVGVHDDTVFGPFPLCLLLELKTKSTKQDSDQLIWAKELEMLGWKIHVIRSMSEFHAAVHESRQRIVKL